jgi:hypothetical protein
MGGLVHLPRTGGRESDIQRRDPTEKASNALRSPRRTSERSRITWLDARPRDGEDDDGGGGSAA